MADEITKLDLYGIFDVPFDADEKEITKAYRKKALKCHPDKNPDNPKAAEEFHQLTQALEILTDKAARAAYDKVLQAKKAAELRHKQLDSKRKKLKEELEAREAAAEKQKTTSTINTKNLQAEIERLRKEGSKFVEEEQARVKEELAKQLSTPPDTNIGARLKLKWKAKKDDPSNGGYSKDVLHKLLDKYGDIVVLLVSSKKNGSAIVEYADQDAAVLASENELGLPEAPLSFTWLSEKPAASAKSSTHASTQPSTHSSTQPGTQPSKPSSTSAPLFASYPSSYPSQSSGGVSGFSFSAQPLSGPETGDGGNDFEELVMRRLRQAEERKRLAEQMAKEDEDCSKT